MSAKQKTVFRCQVCGHVEAKWMGRCPGCRTWESLIEEPVSPDPGPSFGPAAPLIPLAEVDQSGEARLSSGLGEMDRVLGGGIMAGSAVVVGGDPGIGKSTLMLQTLGHLARQSAPVLYVSGEESARQIRIRADRLGLSGRGLFVLTETRVERILPGLKELRPRVVVLDSIQTLQVAELSSTPGSLAQIRESAARFVRLAKETNCPVFLVGHVTKTGALAGPRVVEHMVDTVLYLDGQQGQGFRILRAAKNRFGPTNEIGVFEMKEEGLKEVANPSALFLSERPLGQPGSVVVPCVEGTRPILVEIQALVAPSAFAMPKRTAQGVDAGRVAILSAVLEKKLGLTLSGQDVYVNVAGGVRVQEPAADLGLAVALAGSLLDRVVEEKTVLLGEVGLAGEIRAVAQAEKRLTEAGKLGFTRAMVPFRTAEQIKKPPLELIGVGFLGQALKAVWA